MGCHADRFFVGLGWLIGITVRFVMDWRRQAEAFYREAVRQELGCNRQVLAFLRGGADSLAQGTAARGVSPARWGVACSGGADSLALLLWLYGARASASEGADMAGDAVSGVGDVTGRDVFGETFAGVSDLPLVLHFDHGLRGEASRGDAVFVAEVAHALGWPLFSQTAASSVPAAAVADPASAATASPSEETLRQWRQAFFERSGCSVIFQGHQRGDVAETLLMRIAAGSGLDGLCAPRPVSVRSAGRPVYLRPLLDWDKAQIISLLQQLGIPWREDESNARGDYFRNRVRLDVLPALQTAAGSRDVTAAAALTRSRLEEDAQALDAWLEQVWPELCCRASADCSVADRSAATAKTVDCAEAVGFALRWRQATALPRAMQRRVLWRFLLQHDIGGVFSAAAVDAMLEAFAQAMLPALTSASAPVLVSSATSAPVAAPAPPIPSAVRFSAGAEHFLSLEAADGLLRLLPATALRAPAFHGAGMAAVARQPSAPLPLTPGSVIYLPEGGGAVGMEIVRLDEALRSAIRSGKIPCGQCVYLAFDAAQAPALNGAQAAVFSGGGWPVVRTWQAGDCYHSLGAPGRRKLQDVFTDKKVPRAQRYRLPVVVDPQSGELLWVAGLPPAHARAVQAGTKTALRLTYIPSRKTVSPYLI